jgi:ribokinase
VPDVVVVGQVGRDLVLLVDALPQAGGSVAVQRRVERLGGKGANQAVAMRQLGVSVACVGVVGDDDVGGRLLIEAENDGLQISRMVRRPGAETALLVDLVEDGGTRRLLEHVPEDVLLRPADVDAASDVLSAAACVVVQLQQPVDAVLAALRIARRFGRTVVVDGAPQESGARAAVLRGADVLRADSREAELLMGRRLAGAGEAREAARELIRQGPRLVALAAGEEGNVVAWAGGDEVVPLLDAPVVDPTGGGDAFVAGLTVGLLRGLPPPEAAWWAAAASTLSVARLGGRPAMSVAAVQELVARARPYPFPH